jgi:hypothetical protein
MPKCHWHADREAVGSCDHCGRPTCSVCAIQVAEQPESYHLCPDCLGSIETLVERGLQVEAQQVARLRTYAGAIGGAVLALAMWIFALRMAIAPPVFGNDWLAFVRWIGYVMTGFLSAVLAVAANGNRRSNTISWMVVPVVAIAILAGQYISTNMFWHAHLASNPQDAEALVAAGIITAHEGWWFPAWFIGYWSWRLLTWQDYTVIIVALYLAYALTHQRRLYKYVRPGSAGGRG